MYDTFSLHRAALKPLLCIKGVYKYLNFSDRFSQLRDEIGNNFLSHLWWKFSGTSNRFHLWHRQEINIILSLRHFSGKMSDKKKQKGLLCIALLGVSNGPIQYLKVLAKFGLCSNYSFSQNFCNCSHARILVDLRSIARNFVNPTL